MFEELPADFQAAEEQTLEASLAATPSQRLAWLEDALAFAWKVGALPRPDEEIVERNGVSVMPCTEIPGANGQGRTSDEARANLGEAITLILENRREDALRSVPDFATRETVVVE